MDDFRLQQPHTDPQSNQEPATPPPAGYLGSTSDTPGSEGYSPLNTSEPGTAHVPDAGDPGNKPPGRLRLALAAAAFISVVAGVAAFFAPSSSHTPTSIGSSWAVTSVPLRDLARSGILGTTGSQLTVNGQLTVNNSMVLAPGSRPANMKAGQLFYSKDTNRLSYFNGSEVVELLETSNTTIGGLTGAVGVGQGLGVAGNALTNSGVLSLQGQAGALNLSAGGGISINGLTVANTGVTGLNGTAGQIGVSAASGNVTLSLPQNIDALATPTFAGLQLSAPLSISSGGTGASSLVAGGVVYGNGTGALQATAAGAPGDCLRVSAGGVPVFSTCPGGGGGGGGGAVTAGSAQTPGVLTKFDAVTDQIVDSLVSETGATVTVGGSLTVTAAISATGNIVTAGQFAGSGAGLTNVNAAQLGGQNGAFYTNASNIGTGTLADARLSANVTLQGNTFNGANQLVRLNASGQLPAVSAALLTNINGSNISSGTIADARLSANVAFLNAAQTFLGANTFSNAANSFTGDGSGLSGVDAAQLNGQSAAYYTNASNIGSGTLADGRLSANVTLQGNSFNGSSQLVQTTATGALPVMSGANLTTLNATALTSGTVGDARLSGNVTLQGNTFNGPSQLVRLDASGLLPAISGANLTSLNGGSISSGTVADGRLSVNVTLQGNSFNAASQLVQLNGSTQLPAVSGALLTSLNATNVASGTLADGRLSSNVTLQGNLFNGTNQLVQLDASAQLPAVSGALLTGLDADNISAGTLAVARGGTGANAFGANGVLYGNGNGAIQVTAAGTDGQCLRANASGVPVFTSCPTGGNISAGTSQTAGALVKFDAATNQITDSLLAESGSVITVNGDLSVTGAISGDGSGISGVDAAELGGQAGSYYTNATNIGTGTLSDARLSGNVTLNDANNTLSGDNSFTGTVLIQTATDSAAAFQIQDAAGTSNLMLADTLLNKIGIGQAPVSGGAALQVAGGVQATLDSLPAAAAALNGTLVYDSTAGKFKIYEGGQIKELCNQTDGNCGGSGGGASLQSRHLL